MGACLTPIIPILIKSNLPNGLNIYVLYWMNLITTVFSYWLLAYKMALFQAHQRIDVVSKISIITYSIRYFLQLFIIIVVKNYYLYLIAMLMTQILTNIFTAIQATKIYPNYKPKGYLEKENIKIINQRIKDLFTSKLGSVIVNSADTIVISTFLGLTVLAVYQNYYYILTSIIGLVTIIFNACTAGIGNSMIIETKEKNFNDLKKFTFLIVWIAGFCTCCFLCLYQPFMEIWVGKRYMLSQSAVICFCIYYFVYEVNQLLNTYKDAAGIWHEDRYRPLVTAISNLIMNIILVQFCDIFGVLLSTVLSTLCIGMPWLLHNLFTVLFDYSQLKEYLNKILKYTIIVILSCLLSYIICNMMVLGKWMTLIVRSVICILIPNLIYYVAYKNMKEFDECFHVVIKMINRKSRLKR